MDDLRYTIGSPWINKKFNDEAIHYLSEGFIPYTYHADAIIDDGDQNSNILLIDSGHVQIGLDNIDGNIKTVMIASRGNIISEVNAILNKTPYITAVAMNECRIYKIPSRIFKDRLQKREDLLWEFVEQAALKSHIFVNQISMLAFDRPLKRVKKVLYWMFKHQGEPLNDGPISLNAASFTHQDIADITGLSRVSVSNSFRTLYAEKILMKEQNYYLVHSIEDLLDEEGS